jgi:hypothetical protein
MLRSVRAVSSRMHAAARVHTMHHRVLGGHVTYKHGGIAVTSTRSRHRALPALAYWYCVGSARGRGGRSFQHTLVDNVCVCTPHHCRPLTAAGARLSQVILGGCRASSRSPFTSHIATPPSARAFTTTHRNTIPVSDWKPLPYCRTGACGAMRRVSTHDRTRSFLVPLSAHMTARVYCMVPWWVEGAAY